MVTTNAFQRTFKIRLGDSQGTAFTVERARRQYLVTARHVLPGIRQRDAIEIWHEERWKSLNVTVVGIGHGDLDVAVLAATLQISPVHPLEMGFGGILYSQPVYFLGFPLGLHSGVAEINRGLPIPFVKSGIVSALETGRVQRLYIDTHVNEGFSGGPVVFHPRHGTAEANELRVAGVVTGYVQYHRPVQDADGHHVANAGENTGIGVAIGARHVVDLIEANQIGFQLPTDM